MSIEKPSISTRSKPCTRLLKCFVLQHNVIKTKHLRSLVLVVVRGFERNTGLSLEYILFWFLSKNTITNFGYAWSEQKTIWFQKCFAICGFPLPTQQLLYYGYWLVKRTADTYQAWYLVPKTLKYISTILLMTNSRFLWIISKIFKVIFDLHTKTFLCFCHFCTSNLSKACKWKQLKIKY